MSNRIFRMFVDKMGGSNLVSYRGNGGEIVYDPDIPVLKIADGVTPGGINLAFTQVSPIYAQISSNTNQIPANTSAYVVTYDTQDFISGFQHTIGDTRIRALFDGIYIIVMNGQVERTNPGGTSNFMDMWLRKNGVDVLSSTSRIGLLNQNDLGLVIVNYVIALLANDYIEIVQAAQVPASGIGLVRLTTLAGGPTIPSIIVTIAKVSG